MSDLTCPYCGGHIATQINEREYRCEYCDRVFTPIDNRSVQGSQPSFQQSSQTPPTLQSASDLKLSSKKHRVTAAFLGILLGGFGVHHFYLGNTGRGILYLLFCWTYIPSVVGFIEGIIFLIQSDEKFASKY